MDARHAYIAARVGALPPPPAVAAAAAPPPPSRGASLLAPFAAPALPHTQLAGTFEGVTQEAAEAAVA